MKNGAAVMELIRRYDFRRALAPEIKKRLLDSKKRVYRAILAARPESKPAGLLNTIFGEMFLMNKKAVLALSMAVVVAATGALILVGVPGLRLPFMGATDPGLARVVFVTGDARVEREGQDSPLIQGSEILPGASVLTGPGGLAILQVDELGTFKVNENSRLTFGAVAGRGDTELVLDRGSIYSKLLKRGPGETCRVKTISYTAAVRGTEFLARADDKEKGVRVYEGVVTVATTVSSTDVTRGRGVTVGVSGEMKEHPLSEKEMLLLRRESLYPYRENFKSMSGRELQALRDGIRKEEAEIDLLLASLDGDSAITPLERLRKKGMPLTMLYLRDGSQIAGSVVGQENGKLRLDTGEGIAEIPVDEIIRRVPMN